MIKKYTDFTEIDSIFEEVENTSEVPTDDILLIINNLNKKLKDKVEKDTGKKISDEELSGQQEKTDSANKPAEPTKPAVPAKPAEPSKPSVDTSIDTKSTIKKFTDQLITIINGIADDNVKDNIELEKIWNNTKTTITNFKTKLKDLQTKPNTDKYQSIVKYDIELLNGVLQEIRKKTKNENPF